ncbi:MAG: hypothetical protein IPM52_14400 [Bacteroidetes bacterium]|nr:hypothetical protein [Bacteroidota bacterium]
MPSLNRVLVLSRNFSFCGPLIASFIHSFRPEFEVLVCTTEDALPLPDITRQMLWESYLEQTRFSFLHMHEAIAMPWLAVIVEGKGMPVVLENANAGHIIELALPAYVPEQAEEARNIRDRIKNELFVLLRDRISG